MLLLGKGYILDLVMSLNDTKDYLSDIKGRFTCCCKQGYIWLTQRVDLPVVASRADTKGRFTCCGKQGWHKG